VGRRKEKTPETACVIHLLWINQKPISCMRIEKKSEKGMGGKNNDKKKGGVRTVIR
jgi:hypothetical protein